MTAGTRDRCAAAETLLHGAGIAARVSAAGPESEIASVTAGSGSLAVVQGLSDEIKALGFRYVALALDEGRSAGGRTVVVEEDGARPPRHDEPVAEGP